MENENFSNIPPFTNRGVVMTTGTENRGFMISEQQYILFDWIQGTIQAKDINVYEIFKKIFHVERADVLESPGGLFGYDTTYSYKNIKVFKCNYREDMGYHLYLTGGGCRDCEDLGLDYHDIFVKLLKLDFKFTRCDISIDDFSDKYFNLSMIQECVREGEVSSKFRNSIEFVKTDLASGLNNGYTIWFGSRSSDIQIVFYDKLKERESQNFIVSNSISSWVRLECRFRNSRAGEMINHYCSNSLENFKNIYKGIIFNYLKFVEYSPSDSVKSRWPVKKWWLDFLDHVSKIQFQSINIESSITKSRRWLLDSVSHTNFKVFLSELSDISADDSTSKFLFEFLKNGYKNITDKDMQEINYMRIRSGLLPLNRRDLESYIFTIKEVLISKSQI